MKRRTALAGSLAVLASGGAAKADTPVDLRETGLDTPLVLGGIIPAADIPELERQGVAGILGPGASADEVVGTVRAAAASRR